MVRPPTVLRGPDPRLDDLIDPPNEPAEPPPADDGLRRVDLIVGGYLLAAVLWIVLSSAAADAIARSTSWPLPFIETVKGLGFVLVTALVLRALMRGWADRLAAAADTEHRAVENLRDAARIRTRFLRGISHELRTPLTSIIGYGSTINRHLHELDDDQLEMLSERLVANGQRLERLVLDLLDLEGLSRGQERARVEPVRVDELVGGVLVAIPHDAHAIHADAPRVTAGLDREKTFRIVDELVRNAIRHTPPGTRVQVSAKVEGPFLHLKVVDDGPGIEPAIRDAVFDPFTQGDRAGESAAPGLGIGLALVGRYVELLGGRITAETAPGGGSRFDVVLPVGVEEDVRDSA